MSYAEDVIRLAGDIGGTNTRLAMFGKSFEVLHRKSYRNSDGPLADHVRDFLDEVQRVPAAACFGVAGAVRDGRVTFTNLGWSLHEDELADQVGLDPRRVRLINDMVAHAASLECRFAEPPQVIREGNRELRGLQLLVMPGTGLGLGMLNQSPADTHAWPVASEGGHLDFSPRPGEEKLLDAVRQDVGERVSWEHLLSGPGLSRLHQAIVGRPAEPEAAIKVDQVADTFVRLLGRYCGNLAIATLSTGGVILGGSIVNTLLPRLRNGIFVEGFSSIGPKPLADELAAMPLSVINGDTGLLGAATYASWLLAGEA